MALNHELPVLVTLARISHRFPGNKAGMQDLVDKTLESEEARDIARVLMEYPERPSPIRDRYKGKIAAIKELAGVG
ncbi:MAG: hypothetical protein OXT65_02430 [Alphaproteobacteria bacterium]|nr:hypothetical protein [Alphaproteobacteria bacterium]